jgi:hypothetical protein
MPEIAGNQDVARHDQPCGAQQGPSSRRAGVRRLQAQFDAELIGRMLHGDGDVGGVDDGRHVVGHGANEDILFLSLDTSDGNLGRDVTATDSLVTRWSPRLLTISA